MCGRFAIDDDANDMLTEIVEQHGIGAIKDWQKYWPNFNYNIAPTDPVPVARMHEGQREAALVRWGMVAASSPVFGGGKPLINARIETVATNGLFRKPFAERRCIVPALGYYEWQIREDGKQPFFIRQPDEHLALAGILGAWPDRSKADDDPEKWKLSMSIITMDSHAVPGEVHDRMPGMLTPDSYDDWLGDHLGTSELLDLLKQTTTQVADQIDYYPVSRSVNKVQITKGVPNNGPELVDPVAWPTEPSQPEQTADTLF
ncbi:MAG: response-associated peptidase [Microbacteriaceae bacterium]|nr:response-associated peptidase [Microbacteriaceae bacterium]